jgi:uncharacterized LabA/DUF88 family protein
MITYAFIDSQNLNLSILAQGWQLDFARFRVYLKDKYKVEKAYIFIGYIPGNESLYDFLRESGYIIVFKPTLPSGGHDPSHIKGNVDAELVLHTMIQFQNFDKAMIVSGDGDFHCLIEYLELKEKLHSVLIPNPKKFSALLRRFREHLIFIHLFKEKLSKRSKNERE